MENVPMRKKASYFHYAKQLDTFCQTRFWHCNASDNRYKATQCKLVTFLKVTISSNMYENM